MAVVFMGIIALLLCRNDYNLERHPLHMHQLKADSRWCRGRRVQYHCTISLTMDTRCNGIAPYDPSYFGEPGLSWCIWSGTPPALWCKQSNASVLYCWSSTGL